MDSNLSIKLSKGDLVISGKLDIVELLKQQALKSDNKIDDYIVNIVAMALENKDYTLLEKKL